MSRHPITPVSRRSQWTIHLLCTTSLVTFGASLAPSNGRAQSFINVCTGLGVTLPALQQVPNNTSNLLTGVLSPVTTALNGTIADVNTSLTDVLSGATIGVGVLQNGSVIAVPSSQCNTSSNTLQVSANSGISLGGGQVNGLGGTANLTSSAGDLTAIAIGNNATTGAGLVNAIALGTNATSNYANSVALGANSVTGRGAVSGYMAFGLSATQNSAGEVSVGAPGATRQIANVAAGTLATDAVNLGQLTGSIGTIGTGIATSLGGGASYNSTTGAISGPSYTIGGQTYTNVGSALAASNGLAVQYTPNGSGAATAAIDLTKGGALGTVTVSGVAPGNITSGSTQAVNGGQIYTATLDPTNPQSNLTLYNDFTSITNGGGIKYFHANSTLADSSATGINAVAIGGAASATVTGGVALGSNSIASRGPQTYVDPFTGASLTTTVGAVSVGQPGQERQITNVANGSASTDAVNVGQLQGAIAPLQSASTLSVKYTANGSGNPTAQVNLAGNSSLPAGTTQVALTGVAPGTLSGTSKDAVNGAQLYGTGTSLATILGGGATFDPTTGQVTAPSYSIGGMSYTTVGSALTALDNEANQNTATLKYFHVNSTLAASAASGTDSTAVGPNAQAQGADSVAVGTNSVAATPSSVAIGTGATAQGGQAVAVGAGNTATGNGAVAIGDPNTATGTGAVALGANNTATGQGAVALGNASMANGQGAVALGNASSATGQGSVALGNAATAGAAGAIALGDGATATVAGGVALGSGATAAANNNTTGTVALATTGAISLGYTNAANTATGAVSVGTAGATRQIQNVADGSAAHDAVNVEQLASVVSQTNAALAPVQSAAKLSVQYTADANGNPTNAIDLTKGGTLAAVSITGLAPATTASGAVALGQMPMQYSTAAAPTTPNPAVPSNDVTLVGAMAGAVALHNVASGSLTATSTDAVNGSQLYQTNSQVAALGHSSVQYATNANGSTLSSITLATDQGGPVIIHNLAPGVASSDAATVGQVQAASANSVQYTTVNGVRSNTISFAGGSPGGVTLSNVAPGVLGTDAVNVNQLQASAAGTLTQANAFTAAQINNLAAYTNQQIAQARSDAAGGTALALAASGLRYDDRPGKFSVTGATAYYHDQMGIAFGLGHTSEDGRLRLNAALTASPTMTHPDVGAVIGASYSLD